MRMTIEDIYALSSFEDHNTAIKYLLPFWEKYRKIEQILKDIPYGGDATVENTRGGRRWEYLILDFPFNAKKKLLSRQIKY